MFQKVLAFVAVGLLVAGSLGCGGGSPTVYESQPGPIANPALDRALQKEAAGEELTGKEKRILEDAREAGAVPGGAGDAAAAPAQQ